MEDQLDKIQLDFFKTYNNIESEELTIQAIEGDESKWSSSAMFNFTPFHIERSRGNLISCDIYEKKPDQSIITQAIYKKGKLLTLKNWDNDELIGLSIFLYKEDKEIKQINISVDDDEQELRSITVFYFEKDKIVKKIETSIYGVFAENYVYSNDKIIEIQILKKIDYVNEVIDTVDGITNVPINSFSYNIKYKNNKLFQIIEENGKNILKP